MKSHPRILAQQNIIMRALKWLENTQKKELGKYGDAKISWTSIDIGKSEAYETAHHILNTIYDELEAEEIEWNAKQSTKLTKE